MDFEDDSGIFSIDSNGSPTALQGAETNHLLMQFQVVNECMVTAAMKMHLFFQYLLLLCHIAPLLRNRKGKKRY
jgi:hypothetical protein